MTAPHAAPPIIVRRATGADARAIATVQVVTWRATYRGIVDDAYIDALTIDGRQTRWRMLFEAAPAASHEIFVAETRAMGVVAFASGGPLRDPSLSESPDAELYALYVLPDAQRRGLGRLLVGAVARAMMSNDFDRMLVHVLSNNASARRFYESLGARALVERSLSIGGVEYPERVYAWDDLTTVGARADA